VLGDWREFLGFPGEKAKIFEEKILSFFFGVIGFWVLFISGRITFKVSSAKGLSSCSIGGADKDFVDKSVIRKFIGNLSLKKFKTVFGLQKTLKYLLDVHRYQSLPDFLSKPSIKCQSNR